MYVVVDEYNIMTNAILFQLIHCGKCDRSFDKPKCDVYIYCPHCGSKLGKQAKYIEIPSGSG